MIEPIADAILGQLQTYLPAKIVALQPTFAPALPMDAVVDWIFDDTNQFLKGYPTVQVRQIRTRIENDDLRWQDHVHRIEIGIWVAQATAENLSRLLDRYARCVLETLHERRKANAFYGGNPSFDLRLDDEEVVYTPSLPQVGQFIRGLFIPARAERRDVEYA
jgi:hypothetical protein